MFWWLDRFSAGAYSRGFDANPLQMADEPAVDCYSQAEDDGLFRTNQLVDGVIAGIVSEPGYELVAR